MCCLDVLVELELDHLHLSMYSFAYQRYFEVKLIL